MLAKTYHAVISQDGLQRGYGGQPYPAPPGPSSQAHSWNMDHLPPPLKEVSQGLQWDLLLR